MARTTAAATRTVPTKYAFVNYTDMDSMHDTSTYTQIRKHAMRQVGAAKRRPRGRNQTTIELFWVPAAPDVDDTTHADQETDESQPSTVTAVAPIRRTANDRAFYNTFIRSLSCEVDPFGTASVTLDVPAWELLQYFTFYASRYPNTWTYSSSPLLPNTPAEHTLAISRTLSAALQDVLLGHCLLATAASRVYYTNGVTPVKSQIREKELSLTQTALRLLRTRLESSTSDKADEIETVVACMLHLGSAAFYKGDVRTASLHIKAATMLAERIGGVDAIKDQYVRGRIISFDDLIACMELQPCLLDATYDPAYSSSPSYGDKKVQIDSDGAARDLSTPYHPIVLPELHNLVLELVQYQENSLQLTQSSDTSISKALANRQWLALRLLAIRNRLLALRVADAKAHILRVVVVMWTLLPSTDISQASIANSLAPKLQQLLEEMPLLDWISCENIHLWCLFMGYLCSKEGSHTQEWFAGEVKWQLRGKHADAGGETGLVAALTAFQKRFLYHEVVQRPATEKFAAWLLAA